MPLSHNEALVLVFHAELAGATAIPARPQTATGSGGAMKKAVLTLAAVLALVLTASALGDDFSQGNGAGSGRTTTPERGVDR